jgi:hypothetical protein
MPPQHRHMVEHDVLRIDHQIEHDDAEDEVRPVRQPQ